jgi:DNA-binding SARP family transcriptional activator/TolB-like protein
VVDGLAVEEHRWARRKPKLLVKVLALQPHYRLHREQLAELLWPDADPDSASNNLHKAIHLARQTLEPGLRVAADSHFILTAGQQVVLSAPGELWVVADAFKRAAAAALKGEDEGAYEAALSLYGGDLLAGDIYEDWATRPRERLRDTHRELLQRLARLLEARGQYERGAERLRELVARDPANEEAHRQLMRLYAATGHRQQALRQYRECQEALRRELDAEPERATRALHEEIIAERVRPLPAGAAGGTPRRGAPSNSLAILPLVNASHDQGLEYLSDGITESIINNLSQLPQLKVMARSTVFRYKGREGDPREIGGHLGVRAVLTGRVMQRGDRLNIQTELVDVSDGSQLWGEQYDRRPADIFEVQEEIAREISEKLRLRLTGEERRRLTERHTENIEAYHDYLKGRYYWNKRDIAWLKKGVEHFRRAIDLDPSYAAAYAGLSDSYTLLVVREALPPEEGFAKAKAAAAQALRIDEAFAAAHASLGHAMLHNWEWEGAERELRRAIELSPGYPSAHHWYSEHLTAMGRCEESVAELRLAGELDPLSLVISADLGRAFYYARDYERVIRQEERTLEMDANFWLSHINLGRTYTQKGMHAQAVAALSRACELSPDNTEALSFLAFAHAAAGERDAALAILRDLDERARHAHIPPYHFAVVHAGLGEQGGAFEWLERAYDRHAVDLFTLKVEPMFDRLRPDPRFADLVRRVGLA